MNEPTLTFNRQLAKESVECLRASIREREWFHEKIYLRIIEQYITLTDPTPLTAEHCREAGGTDMGDILVVPGVGWLTGGVDRPIRIGPAFCTMNPAVGQLRLALLKDNPDGE